jgi:hypothetical protein
MLDDLLSRLYAEKPTRTLYHYTSLQGLLGIVEGGHLWVSETRHLNDVEELGHFGRAIYSEIALREAGDPEEAEIASQLAKWLPQRLASGPLIFAGSFTENGNLLSQWRGYCPHGQGVSMGFHPERLAESAAAQSFLLGRCIYAQDDQQRIASAMVEAIIAAAKAQGKSPPNKAPPTQSYHGVFQQLEDPILTAAALVKNPAFSEEQEWRVVSPSLSNYVVPPIHYRAGASMLVPYLEFELPKDSAGLTQMTDLWIGPTPTMNLSMRSLGMYLRKRANCPLLRNCQIPFRA